VSKLVLAKCIHFGKNVSMSYHSTQLIFWTGLKFGKIKLCETVMEEKMEQHKEAG
jgi:hypothetical protein